MGETLFPNHPPTHLTDRGNCQEMLSHLKSRELKDIRYETYNDKDNDEDEDKDKDKSAEKTQHMLNF